MPIRRIIPTEAQDQIAFADWLTRKGYLFYAICNGGTRNAREAVNLNRQGLKKGVPDLCIPMPSKGYHGLYLELKRLKGGFKSCDQKYWVDELNKQGYKALFVKGFEEAKNAVEDYFSVQEMARTDT